MKSVFIHVLRVKGIYQGCRQTTARITGSKPRIYALLWRWHCGIWDRIELCCHCIGFFAEFRRCSSLLYNIGVILGFYWGYIGVILYGGNIGASILGVLRTASYYSGLVLKNAEAWFVEIMHGTLIQLLQGYPGFGGFNFSFCLGFEVIKGIVA